MFCKKCGATLKDGAVFCKKCGARLTVDSETASEVTESEETKTAEKEVPEAVAPVEDAAEEVEPVSEVEDEAGASSEDETAEEESPEEEKEPEEEEPQEAEPFDASELLGATSAEDEDLNESGPTRIAPYESTLIELSPMGSSEDGKIKKSTICPSCGMNNQGDFAFCMRCGTELSGTAPYRSMPGTPAGTPQMPFAPMGAAPGNQVPAQVPPMGQYPMQQPMPGIPAQAGAAQAPANKVDFITKIKNLVNTIIKTPKYLIICGAVLLTIIIAVVTIIIVAANSNKKLNLSQFTTVEYTGYETDGKAILKFDYEKFNKKIGRSLKYTKEGKTNYAGIAPKLSFENILSGYVKEGEPIATNLSNGDKVEFDWDRDLIDTLERNFKLIIVGNSLTDTAKGLKTASVVDIFKDVYIEYKGIAPYASASVHNGTNPYGLEFRLDKSSGLRNGDTIVISTSLGGDLKDHLTKNYGVLPESETKTITVSGLTQYILKPEDIPADFMAKLQSQADAANQSLLTSTMKKTNEYLVSTTCMGYYLLTKKNIKDGTGNNIIIFVYRNVVHHTAYDWYDDRIISRNHSFYNFSYISDVSILPDGSSSVDLSTMKSYHSKDCIVRFYNTKYSDERWAYYGFTDLEKLKRQAVSRYVKDYDCIDMVDKTKAN